MLSHDIACNNSGPLEVTERFEIDEAADEYIESEDMDESILGDSEVDV